MPARFKIEVTGLKIDKRATRTKAIESVMRSLVKEAAKTFVETIVDDIPVVSGMALASLRPVARAVQAVTNLNQKLASRVGRQGYRYNKAGTRIRNGIRSNRIAEGEARGGPTGGLNTVITHDGNGFFTFNFTTDVGHFILRESTRILTDVNPQLETPWLLVERAGRAMRVRLNDLIRSDFRSKLKSNAAFTRLKTKGAAGTPIIIGGTTGRGVARSFVEEV